MPPIQSEQQQPLSTHEIAVNKDKKVAETAVYTLKIGEYVSSELESITKKVIVAGLVPQVATGPKQPRQVIRLKAGTYQSCQVAQKERSKLLRDISSRVFILKKGKGDYRLYAGSYLNRKSALKEQQRLAALGITLKLEEASVMLPASTLTAGRFMSREAAEAGVVKLKKLGVKLLVQKSD